jgi:hypothetical protein
MLQARASAAGADSHWAVVVDDEDRLLGWIDLDPALVGCVEAHLIPFEVHVPLGTTLRAALGEMLQHDLRWIPVVDEERYQGVLTPNRLHAAMRRSGWRRSRGATSDPQRHWLILGENRHDPHGSSGRVISVWTPPVTIQ